MRGCACLCLLSLLPLSHYNMRIIIPSPHTLIPPPPSLESTCTVLPRCYAPPLLRPTFRKKRGGGGVTTRTCAFASQLSPPRPPSHEIRVLCSAVEDENSFDRHAVAVLKDGRVVGHVHVAKHSRQSRSQTPPTGHDGLRKPSEISEKGQDQFSNYFLHA